MKNEITITAGLSQKNSGEIVFGRTNKGTLIVMDKKSQASIEFNIDWLMNLDWENLRQIKKSMVSPGLRLYYTKGDADFALLTARRMFKRWPNVTAVNNFAGYAFRVERGNYGK